MLKKLFRRRKTTSAAAEPAAGTIKHVYTKDDGGNCPKCGAGLTRRSCWLALGGMTGEKVVETDIGRLCDACPTMVLATNDVAKLSKREKLKGALPVGTAVSATDEPVEFETFDGTPLSELDSGNSDLMSMFAQMMGVDPAMLASMQEGGAPSMEGPRKTLSPAQRQKRKSKRKQASKARKNNRKRK